MKCDCCKCEHQGAYFTLFMPDQKAVRLCDSDCLTRWVNQAVKRWQRDAVRSAWR